MSKNKIPKLDDEFKGMIFQDSMLLTRLNEDIERLTKKLAVLEKKKDYFEVGDIVWVNNTSSTNMLVVTKISIKNVWLRHGNKKPFIKRKTNVTKVDIGDLD